MRFALIVAAMGLSVSLMGCSEVVKTEAIKIGGERFTLETVRKPTSSGFVTVYKIYEDDDDPIAECESVRDCVRKVEEEQRRLDPVPELLRRPKQPSLPGDTPELTSSTPDIPLETAAGD